MSNNSANPPSIVLDTVPPETPRSKSAHTNASTIPHGLNRLSTPLFPFGLSFSPTFNFNTPSGVSPTRFFDSARSTERVTTDKNNTPCKDHYKFLASLNSVGQSADAGHQEQGQGHTPKDARNSKDKGKKQDGDEDEDEEEEEEEEEVWSSINTTQQNQSNLTSIHEIDHNSKRIELDDNDFKIFQTPAKTADSKTNRLPINLVSARDNVQIGRAHV